MLTILYANLDVPEIVSSSYRYFTHTGLDWLCKFCSLSIFWYLFVIILAYSFSFLNCYTLIFLFQPCTLHLRYHVACFSHQDFQSQLVRNEALLLIYVSWLNCAYYCFLRAAPGNWYTARIVYQELKLQAFLLQAIGTKRIELNM